MTERRAIVVLIGNSPSLHFVLLSFLYVALKQSPPLSPIRPCSRNITCIQYITQSYNLTFHDVYVILTSNFLWEESRQVWGQARAYAEEIHQNEKTYPVGSASVTDQESEWDCNISGDILARNLFFCEYDSWNKRNSGFIKYIETNRQKHVVIHLYWVHTWFSLSFPLLSDK